MLFYKLYRYIRIPIKLIVGWLNIIGLTKFFEKCDHWVRIQPTVSRVITSRNGINYSLDLKQLIDNQVFFETSYEPDTSAAFSSLVKPGMCVIDIGANVGIHTLTLSSLVSELGRVYAIEPTDWAFEKLITNIELNSELSKNITARKLALTDKNSGMDKYQFRAQWNKSGEYIKDESGSTDFISRVK